MGRKHGFINADDVLESDSVITAACDVVTAFSLLIRFAGHKFSYLCVCVFLSTDLCPCTQFFISLLSCTYGKGGKSPCLKVGGVVEE